MSKIKCELQVITPDIARRMIEGNIVNRHIRANRVGLYAKQMREGQWRVTGESIILSSTGRLLDGQHRLLGCIEADVPFTSIVVRGVFTDTMAVMDSGAARTASDTFNLEGIPHSALLSATCRNLIAVEAGIQRNAEQMALITRDDLLSYYEKHAAELMAAIPSGSAVYRQLKVSWSAWVSVAFLTAASDPEQSERFMYGLATGADLAVGDPRLALRSYYLANRRDRWFVVIANGLKAWNAHIEHRSVRKFQGWFPPQGWPEAA